MAAGLLLAVAPGCALFEPQPAPPQPVNNPDAARVFSAKGTILSPEEAKKKREASVIDPTMVEERDDVVSIQQFWNPQPWINDAAGQPVGFRVPVYLVSGETEKGAFVPGTIICWMYHVDPDAPAGTTNRQPLYIWELPRSDAMGFRVRKKALMGFPYYFVLKWPETMTLAGETVEVEFGYERLDKRLVLGAPQRFRVPPPIGSPRRKAPAESPPATARQFTPEELAALRRQVAKEPGVTSIPAEPAAPNPSAPRRVESPRPELRP